MRNAVKRGGHPEPTRSRNLFLRSSLRELAVTISQVPRDSRARARDSEVYERYAAGRGIGRIA